MANTLRQLWKFMCAPGEEMLSVEAAKSVFELAKTIGENKEVVLNK